MLHIVDVHNVSVCIYICCCNTVQFKQFNLATGLIQNKGTKHLQCSTKHQPDAECSLIQTVNFWDGSGNPTLHIVNVGGINCSDSIQVNLLRQQQRKRFCWYWWKLSPKQLQLQARTKKNPSFIYCISSAGGVTMLNHLFCSTSTCPRTGGTKVEWVTSSNRNII